MKYTQIFFLRALLLALMILTTASEWAVYSQEPAAIPKPGDSWNESQIVMDAASSRVKRRLTTEGLHNNTASYHFLTGISGDSRYAFIKSRRQGYAGLIRADLETGGLTWIDVFSEDSTNFDNLDFIVRPKHNSLLVKVFSYPDERWKVFEIDYLSMKKQLVLQFDTGVVVSTIACTNDGASLLWAERPWIKGLGAKATFDAYTQKYGGMPTTYYQYSISENRR